MTIPDPHTPAIAIRDAVDTDADGLIALIGGVFAEYPGCYLDVDGEMPELRAIASRFRAWGGQFWVAELGGEIVGSVGYKRPSGGEGVELCKLYVARRARRRGLGSALCARVEAAARAHGAAFVELWSDSRFEDAHRLYAQRGYARGEATLELHDISNTVEYYFRLALAGGAGAGADGVGEHICGGAG